ncbi:MAG: transposase [Bacteroidales bacterium]|nr:transposase [Bacteroidales bacterium]
MNIQELFNLFSPGNLNAPYLDYNKGLTISERNLLHWQQDGVLYFVTRRLNDSLPQVFIEQYLKERQLFEDQHPRPWDKVTHQEYLQRFPNVWNKKLDAGHGACALSQRDNALHLERIMMNDQDSKCALLAYVLMPNHFHVLVWPKEGITLRRLVGTWMRISAHAINKEMGQEGRVWQEEGHDWIVRNEGHLKKLLGYFHHNYRSGGLILRIGPHRWCKIRK